MGTQIQLDGFNDRLLSGHWGVGVRASRAPAFAGWAMLAAGLVAGGYWNMQTGAVQRAWEIAASSVRDAVRSGGTAPVLGEMDIKPITVRVESETDEIANTRHVTRQEVLARLDMLEAEAVVRRDASSEQVPAELERLRLTVEKPVAQAPKREPEHRASLPVRPEKEAQIIIARPAPSARQAPAAVDAVRPEVEDQSGLLLFKKRETAAPVLDRPVVATPVKPAAVPVQAVPAARPEAADREPAAVALADPPIRAPLLVVEVGGVRVVGPEGERFIPIGGKLNGKHILATSPEIGLIVTEDSAIRVNNQEQR